MRNPLSTWARALVATLCFIVTASALNGAVARANEFEHLDLPAPVVLDDPHDHPDEAFADDGAGDAVGARANRAETPVRELVALPPQWVKEAVGPIEFYFDPAHRSAVAPLMALAGESWARITEEVGLAAGGGTRILVAKNPEEYHALQPDKRVARWSAGVTYSSLNLVIVRLSGLGGDAPEKQLRETLVHELSHVIVHRALAPRRAPRWLLEGLAMHHSREVDWQRTSTLVTAAVTSGLIPMRNLERDWPQGTFSARLAYAQSIEFIHLLIDREGRGALAKLLQEFRATGDMDAALTRVYGRDLVGLEKDFASRFRFWYAIVPAVTSGGAIWALTSVLFLFAWRKKRRQAFDKLAAMEREEAAERLAATMVTREAWAARKRAALAGAAAAADGSAPDGNTIDGEAYGVDGAPPAGGDVAADDDAPAPLATTTAKVDLTGANAEVVVLRKTDFEALLRRLRYAEERLAEVARFDPEASREAGESEH